MIESLKPYSEYKESEQAWLGRVPAHWEVLPLGRLLAERKEKNEPIKTNNILSLSLHDGVLPYADKRPGGNKAKDDLTAYKLAYPGDIVLNSMNVVVGSVGLSKYFGAVSPVYYMLYPRHAHDLVEFFDAIFQHSTFHRSLFGLGNGILVIQSKSSGKLNTIRMRIPMTKLKLVLLPYPAPEEQAAIVRFLNYAKGPIERVIRTKKKMIGLLNEQKQAIIHRAVTCGLDPNVHLKPSGIDFLGDVPDGWKVAKLGFKATVKARLGWKGLKAQEYVDKGIVFLSTPNIKNKDIDFDNVNYITAERYYESPEIMLQEGDVLIVKDGSTLGITNVIRVLPSLATVNSSIAVIRCNEELYSIFLYYLLSSFYIQNVIQKMKDGQGVPHLFQADIRKFWIWLPSLQEQHAIAVFLEHETGRIDELVNKMQESISKIREYRTRLIADVITGKFDVRGVELPAMDETETLLDIDTVKDIELEAEDLIESEEVADADE